MTFPGFPRIPGHVATLSSLTISMVFSCLCCCHSSQKSLFWFYLKDKSFQSNAKFRQASNHCKIDLQAVKIAYTNKRRVHHYPETQLSGLGANWSNGLVEQWTNGAMAYRLRRWIPNPGVSCSKPLGGSQVNSAFHPSKVDKMSTRNFWELNGKK